MKECGLEICQMDMEDRNGRAKIFIMKDSFSMERNMDKENIILHNLSIKGYSMMMNLIHMDF